MPAEWSRKFVPHPSAPADPKSTELDALAAEKDLGPVVHRGRGSSEHLTTLKWAGPIMLFLGIALPLLIAFGDVTPLPQRRGRRPTRPSPMQNLVHDPRGWLGPFAVLFGITAMVQWVLVSGIRLQVHERGLAYRRLGTRWAVRWDEIAVVRASITHVFGGAGPGLRGWVTMEKQVGGTLKLTPQVEGLEAVRDIVREATFDHLYEPVEEALAESRPVTFGPVVLRRDGLVKNGEFQPWRAIEKALIWDGKLEVHVAGKRLVWLKVKTRDIPNVHVLMPAIDEHRHAG